MTATCSTAAGNRLARFGWNHPTMLAPMEGAGHPPFRAMVAERGGVGILCTEFVRVHGSDAPRSLLERAIVKVPGVPLSVQVMGNDAELMADAGRIVAGAGADVVDINLGCPMPRVVRKGVGAAMLKDPALLAKVLRAMRAAVPGVLSAKIRAGFDADCDASQHAVTIARVVEDAGVDFIAVHPRRRADFYAGVADWRIVAELRRALRIPVIGNGDIWYAADFARMRSETGCDGVMVGRPALRNPWIFGQAAALAEGRTPFAPTGADVLAYLEEAAGRIDAVYPGRALGRMKEIARYIGRAVPDELAFQREALRSPDLPALLDVARRRLEHLPADGLDLQADGHLGLERSGRSERAGDGASRAGCAA
ncbi:MAG: tRNA-dihydrouridine synthase family protein [Polyangiales bacterium]|nr:tRNA-dihydrouridine synthase family protein [Myxococcales bacterium]MCB9657634.1 tRNA-dihydrouridine synthase family protein [Sandaracinaceae bacterium]